MKSFIMTAAVVALTCLTMNGTASAQNPYKRSNAIHGAYISGWPIYGATIHGDSIHGTYIAPPSTVQNAMPVPYYQPAWTPNWTQTYSYPIVTMPNYSSGIPTNYNYDWRWYRR